jgi:hypothetical protein
LSAIRRVPGLSTLSVVARESRSVGQLGWAECDAADGMVAAARDGAGGSLVLRGPLGAGKTTLLEHAAGQGVGMRVVRTAGIESETALEFAALQQIVSPFLPRLERLPAPQRDALGAAFGLVDGTPTSSLPVWRC